MSLTYQPFAQTPAVDRLSRDLEMNVPDGERMASGLAGACLVIAGFGRTGVARWAFLSLGGALIWRGVSGRCECYRRLDLDKRHDSSGVPGNRGTRVEASIEIACAAEPLFQFWSNLEQLPRVMRHVESVRQVSPSRSHWKVRGPGGQTLEWDAEIINQHAGRLIAWQSLPGASVRNAGSVWFEPLSAKSTRVKVAFEFDPPAGMVGTAVAKLLGSSPQADLAADLAGFKEFAERELSAAGASNGNR